MRIGLITTLDTNVGDDFIREGICAVLRESLAGQELEFVPVNKHQPLTVYPEGHPVRLFSRLIGGLPHEGRKLTRWTGAALSRLGRSLFDRCDLIVQCGTPVIWANCSHCEWAVPLWDQVIGRLSREGVPVLNLGAGSCYPWETQPERVESQRDASYLRQILGYCRVTTTRDRLAQRLFESLGQSCAVIPCPAFLAGKAFASEAADGEFFVINYMEGGGHYDLGQNIDANAWRSVVKDLVKGFLNKERVLFLCHNKKEYELAAQIGPGAPRFLAQSANEYFSVLSRAKGGICNRLHASVALAGMGIPTVAVGTDTRLAMVETLGLPALYVKRVSVEILQDAVNGLQRNRREECERLRCLREQTWSDYTRVFQGVRNT